MAGIHLLTSDAFYKSTPTFIEVCNVLSGGLYDPATWDPADALECAWGITEAMLLAPPDEDDEEPFSREIRAYIGAALDQEGILNPPDVLRIAVRGTEHDLATQVAAQYDEETRGVVARTEAAKVGEIGDRVRDNLRTLVGQLGALHLAHGDAGSLAGKLARTLGKE